MNQPPGGHIEVDEILPPGKGGRRSGDDAQVKDETSRIIAYWLDEFIRIPGTKIRIGLDPIIAFVPFIGDFLASSAGVVILIESARNGVSIPVLARMGMNMLFNTFLDVIPGIGPFFSAFFKSNTRNLHLLQQWQAGNQAAVKRGTWMLFGFVALLGALGIALWVALWMFYISLFMKLFP
jgi:Domain of unknown function (DUF4112)